VVRQRRGPFVYEGIDRSTADMIIAVDGETTKTADDLLSAIERHRPGEEVMLTIVRGGRRVNVGVVLGAGE
jgi:S1-C subfamily serine protease